MHMLSAMAVGVVAVIGPPVGKADLTLSTSSYTYFHRTGSTLEGQQAELRECLRDGRGFYQPGAAKPIADGIAGAALNSVLLGLGRSSVLFANVENCMVARRWEVVQLPIEAGKSLDAMSADALQTQLRGLVGAAEVKGEIVRRWRNEAVDPRAKIFGAARPNERLPLTVKALPERSSEAGIISPKPRPRVTGKLKAVEIASLTEIPAGNAAVFFRRRVGVAKAALVLTRIDAGGDLADDGQANQLWVAPAKGMKFKTQELTLAFVIPPGRWVISWYALPLGDEPVGINFCWGAPAFEIKSGEALYSGRLLTQGAGVQSPAASELEELRAEAQPSIADKLKVASYMPGTRSRCGGIGYGYALDLAEKDGG